MVPVPATLHHSIATSNLFDNPTLFSNKQICGIWVMHVLYIIFMTNINGHLL